jgi:hypothetical protein
MRICRECKVGFKPTYSRSSFCSNECRDKWRAGYKHRYDVAKRKPRLPQACENCKTLFVRPQNSFKLGKFCSRKCQQATNWQSHYAENRSVLIARAQKREQTRRTEIKKTDPAAYTRMRFVEHIKGKYGISGEQYDQMVHNCSGCCACCERPTSRLLVDHDHATGATRGLLCNRCNVLAGYLEKNPHLVELALAYLQKHKATVAA